jgi:hypothetical protein
MPKLMRIAALMARGVASNVVSRIFFDAALFTVQTMGRGGGQNPCGAVRMKRESLADRPRSSLEQAHIKPYVFWVWHVGMLGIHSC